MKNEKLVLLIIFALLMFGIMIMTQIMLGSYIYGLVFDIVVTPLFITGGTLGSSGTGRQIGKKPDCNIRNASGADLFSHINDAPGYPKGYNVWFVDEE